MHSGSYNQLIGKYYPDLGLLFHAHAIPECLEQVSHALWTHPEARHATFCQAKALVILIHVLKFLFKRFRLLLKHVHYACATGIYHFFSCFTHSLKHDNVIKY